MSAARSGGDGAGLRVADVGWAAFVGLLYLGIRLLLWPLWERPLQAQDFAFAAVLAAVTFVVRQARFRR